MQYANRVMNDFKAHQQAYMTVDKILQLCSDNNAKFFGLQVLDDAINVSTQACNQIFLSFPKSD